MSGKMTIHILLITVLISISMGCTAPESGKNTVKEHIVGGVAVGVSPRVIYAERGENVSFNVDLQSTENADDRVTINVNGTWFSTTIFHDIKAGGNASVPVKIDVPDNASNMSLRIEAKSSNFNATSSTTGMIIMRNKR